VYYLYLYLSISVYIVIIVITVDECGLVDTVIDITFDSIEQEILLDERRRVNEAQTYQ